MFRATLRDVNRACEIEIAPRTRACRVMPAVFEGPLRFSPIDDADGRRYRVTGTASIRSLLDVTEGGPGRFTNFASACAPSGICTVSEPSGDAV